MCPRPGLSVATNSSEEEGALVSILQSPAQREFLPRGVSY